MSSVALVLTAGLNACNVVARVGDAMADRSPVWACAGDAAAAVAAGEDTQGAAEARVHTLGDMTVIAASAPEWVVRQLDELIARLRSCVMSPELIASRLASITGDVHCVAALGPGIAVAYRGPLSPRPLFYYSDSDGLVVVASQIRGIRAVKQSVAVDVPGLAPFLVPALCDRQGSAWAGVHRLPPGHALIVRDGRIEVRQVAYVDTEQGDLSDRAELIAQFRQLLDTALVRCSRPRDGLLLSGGIDSACLTVAAARILPQPRAFSMTYSSPELAACDERRYVDCIADATQVPVTRLLADDILPLVSGYRLADEPEVWTYAARNQALLRRIVSDSEPVGSLIAGEGGDELLLGQVFTVADRSARGDAEGAAREVMTFPNPSTAMKIVDGLLAGHYERRHTRIHRALGDIPPWLSEEYRDRCGLVDRIADRYPRLATPGRFTPDYSRALIGEAGAAGRAHCGGWWDDTVRRAGLRVTYPFFDPDLVVAAWGLPPQLLRDNGIEKVVLREAVCDELPADVAARRDKADALAMMRAGLSRGADRIRHVAAGGPLVDLGVVDPATLRTAVDEYLAGHDAHGPGLWATVAVNTWLLGDQNGGPVR
ncbi:asparagine synthase-related protein [Nocardia sp. NPDC052566]|uniref:asparagine synthase-related protein n=1 Tax=Nocardia sp. NPDC052566 TaxID=3364330 RepID=UPI0037CC78B1